MADFLKECSIEGCAKPAKARGWCSTHSQRFYRTGSPTGVRKTVVPGSLEDRVWARVERGPTCWRWIGTKSAAGYGQVGAGGVILYAHRLVCEWTYGPAPEGTEVLHSCDNAACVNPAHLRWGTRAENVQDMITRGRGWWQRAV